MDCIIASLSIAGSDLVSLDESVFGERLCWEASLEGGRGLGLPTIEEWPLLKTGRFGNNEQLGSPRR